MWGNTGNKGKRRGCAPGRQARTRGRAAARTLRRLAIIVSMGVLLFLALYAKSFAGATLGGPCMGCHNETYARSMAYLYKHDVVGEQCGICHIARDGERELYNTSSTGFKSEVLLPLDIPSGAERVSIELLATDVLGRRSDAVRLAVNPGDMGELPDGAAAPVIGDLKVEEMSRAVFIGATLSWTTDLFTRSVVEYGEDATAGAAGEWRYAARISSGLEYSTRHSIELASLKKNTVYRYRVVATDIYGNVARSGYMTLDTSAATPPAGAAAAVDMAGAPEGETPVIENVRAVKTHDGRFYLITEADRPARFWLVVKQEAGTPDGSEHGPGFLPARVSQTQVCLECHPGGVSHPVGVSAKSENTSLPHDIPTLDGGIISCITCHFPHGGDSEYFARLDFQTDLCVQCHTSEPYAPGGKGGPVAFLPAAQVQ